MPLQTSFEITNKNKKTGKRESLKIGHLNETPILPKTLNQESSVLSGGIIGNPISTSPKAVPYTPFPRSPTQQVIKPELVLPVRPKLNRANEGF